MSAIVDDFVFFCEGERKSPDVLLYQRLVPAGWYVHPFGGKRSTKQYVRGYFRSDVEKKTWFALVDRDLDNEPGVHVLYDNVWTTRRTKVENYLLDPAALWRSFEGLRGKPGAGKFRLPSTLGEVSDALGDIVKSCGSAGLRRRPPDRLARAGSRP